MNDNNKSNNYNNIKRRGNVSLGWNSVRCQSTQALDLILAWNSAKAGNRFNDRKGFSWPEQYED
jgi:hypothetical protein